VISVLLHSDQTITVPGTAKDVKLEGGALIIRRGDQITARFGKHVAWWETAGTDGDQ
jgi:hypothetical protein